LWVSQDDDCALRRGKDSEDHRDALSFAPDLISLKKFFILGRSLRICSALDLFV
jgi:hypothetical protein